MDSNKTINTKIDNQFLFYVIKVTNIFYVGVLYMILGGSLSYLVDNLYPNRTEKELHDIHIIQLGIEVVLMSAFLFVMVYMVRVAVKKIGSPLHNVCGFDFYRLKELGGGVVLSLALILFSNKLILMSQVFSKRISKLVNNDKNNNKNNNKNDKNK